MRRLSPRPKAILATQIPERLRDAMRELLHQIREVENDADNGLEHDDGIQVDCLIGGRCGTDERPYQFTYYPSAHTNHDRWYLTLSSSELEAVAEGTMSRIRMHCCTSPDCQMKFREVEGLYWMQNEPAVAPGLKKCFP
jgi:hypothetical protein